MKLVLTLAILLYQRVAPRMLRSRCIFSESCSNFVLRKTNEEGFRAGITALTLRVKRCRPGYFRLHTSKNYRDLDSAVCLADGSVVDISNLTDRVRAELG
jgi:hypothetical protein